MQLPKEIDLKIVSFPECKKLDSNETIDHSGRLTNMDGGKLPDASTLNYIKALTQLSSQSWRLNNLVIDPETDQVRSELSPQDIRKLANIAEAMVEITQSSGFRVIDRCGEDFHPGLPDVVVTEEPREGISKERIIRTIRPTILHGQTMVQRGEIDIAVPTEKKL
jgi:hypothetical protein